MDPENVRELLEIVKEIAQPIYELAYRQVVISNTIGLIAGLSLIMFAVVAGIFGYRWNAVKGDYGMARDRVWACGTVATICAIIGVPLAITSLVVLLNPGYYAYMAILNLVKCH